MKRLILFFFLILLFLKPAKAFIDSTQVAKDLRSEWLVYNISDKSYISYQPGNKNSYCVYNWVLLKNYSGYNLNFNAPPYTSFFVNNRLIYNNFNKREEQITIKLDAIELNKNRRSSLFALYNPNQTSPDYKYIVNGAPQKKHAQ